MHVFLGTLMIVKPVKLVTQVILVVCNSRAVYVAAAACRRLAHDFMIHS